MVILERLALSIRLQARIKAEKVKKKISVSLHDNSIPTKKLKTIDQIGETGTKLYPHSSKKKMGVSLSREWKLFIDSLKECKALFVYILTFHSSAPVP
jgi:hypothetical protein